MNALLHADVSSSKGSCNKKMGCRGEFEQSCSFMRSQGRRGRQERREGTDLQRQIETFVYTQVAIQTGDAGSIRK